MLQQGHYFNQIKQCFFRSSFKQFCQQILQIFCRHLYWPAILSMFIQVLRVWGNYFLWYRCSQLFPKMRIWDLPMPLNIINWLEGCGELLHTRRLPETELLCTLICHVRGYRSPGGLNVFLQVMLNLLLVPHHPVISSRLFQPWVLSLL